MNTAPSTTRRILVIEGHPDKQTPHLNQALADAYAQGASDAGHEVRRIAVADLDFPVLRRVSDWHQGEVPPALKASQADILWAQHVVFFFPLWLGEMPALLKAYLEQVARPGFAIGREGPKEFGRKPLSGRSARVVVTMGMPALVYRWYFRAHSLKALERNILGFVGFGPIHETLVGSVEQLGDGGVALWLARLRRLGRKGG
ncbi:NAD(P)H-dependent oxidoreductase [Hydrogenophaga sp.]|uniref:NAD(P)H-dependent oxidoreductase n=1 Tax=Hydrogenophaga sp. TaxID=1904254 RepID=UPI002626AD00|nr:NAD(P)H-dependent oxidoreductase [Hydrogenophaga sp.]MCW5653482.1 NAD(P)H-dependent oxidoreductase [Hydrogenophaga sp.]